MIKMSATGMLWLVSLVSIVCGNFTEYNSTEVWPEEKDIKEQQRLICKHSCECPPEGQTEMFMDCSGKGIKALPDGLMLSYDLTGISFEQNEIQNVSQYTFVDAPTVEELDLGENQISRIESEAFLAFQSLTLLRLSSNKLRRVPEGLLAGLEELRLLELGHNELSELPELLFAPTKQLREIRIQHNRFEILPEDTFKHLPNLEKLDFSGNSLKTLHPGLFRHTQHLTWLSLEDNQFEVVPKEALSVPKKLNSLDLSGNRFTELQQGAFSSLNNVSVLYLNNIHTLSRITEYAFENMTNLKFLYCSFNGKLSFIHPDAFKTREMVSKERIPPIDQLFLRQNALRDLPESEDLHPWLQLTFLDVRENPWKCDCNLRWMKKVKQEVFNTLRCQTPLSMHGRSFPAIREMELECYEPWMLSSIIIVLTSLLAFVVCAGFVMIVVCSRTPIGSILRSRAQFTYSKVTPKTDAMDLEWDPSADL